MQENSLYKAIR